ncbi:HAD family phosphatase [Draconibacterium sp.]|jgi:HAD superfamily hydrolase (TIGR01509 family)
MKSYSAYLFDMDGTLVDSEKLKGLALVKTCGHFGGCVDVDSYKMVMGKSWGEVTNYFFAKAQIAPDFYEFNAVFKQAYQELLLNELKPNSNVVELLSNLKERGKKIGIVSSAFGWMVDQVLTQLDLKKFFDVVVTQEDVTLHKPDPEAYFLALKKLELPGSEVLIFEDSESGVVAAKNAGCDTVALMHDFNTNHDFSLALRAIEDFNAFLENSEPTNSE